MKFKLCLWLTTLVLLGSAWAAQAAISCTISSSGVSAGYTTGSATRIVVQGSFSITCSRGLLIDSTTTGYTVKVNNGQQASGQNNFAKSGTNQMGYDTYIDSACGTQWRGNTTIPSSTGTLNMSGFTPTTVTQNFWVCIASGQTVASGTYTDTVTMTPTYDLGVLGGTGTMGINIVSPATCAINNAPSALSIAYSAFSSTTVNATSNFGVNCSNGLPYTMAVSPASNTLAGIGYTLSLTSSATGSGATQSYAITGTAAANQGGTCSSGTCTATQLTTLTISY